MEIKDLEISSDTFISIMQDKATRYCYILGAGASVESGIPSGESLATKFRVELKSYNDNDVNKWKYNLNITKSDEDLTYSELYDLRYYNRQHEGVHFISEIMEKSEPSIGYYFLTEQLIDKNNIVITTNFDNLIEKSLSIYQDIHCRVVFNEELARYINLDSKKPQIIKPHGDAMFAPKSSSIDVNKLSKKWVNVLNRTFTIDGTIHLV